MLQEITSMGLKPIDTAGLFVGEGQNYWYGHSSSPDHVIVTRIEKTDNWRVNGGAWVYFRKWPYHHERKEKLALFKWCAKKGSATKLESLKAYAEQGENEAALFAATIADLAAVLSGKPGIVTDWRDLELVKLRILYTGKMDGWREFERTWPNSISGQDNSGANPVLELYTDRKEARAMLVWCGHDEGADFSCPGGELLDDQPRY